MNEKDFFDKVEKSIDENQTKKNEKDIKNKELFDFFVSEMKNITPMLENYELKLNERGLKSELRIGENSFSFTIKHKNGDDHILSFGIDFQDKLKSYRFSRHFRDEKDGTPYKSIDGKSYTQTNWNQNIVEEKIQNHVEDFMFYQNRHM